MGEVIQGDFGREPKNKRDLPTLENGVAGVSELQGSETIDSPEEVAESPRKMRIEDGLDLGAGTFFVARKIKDAIGEQVIRGSNQQSMRDLVSQYTSDEVNSWITNSTETDWVAKPAFFVALADRRLSEGLGFTSNATITTHELPDLDHDDNKGSILRSVEDPESD